MESDETFLHACFTLFMPPVTLTRLPGPPHILWDGVLSASAEGLRLARPSLSPGSVCDPPPRTTGTNGPRKNGPGDERTTEERTTEERTTDERTTDERTTDERTTDERTSGRTDHGRTDQRTKRNRTNRTIYATAIQRDMYETYKKPMRPARDL